MENTLVRFYVLIDPLTKEIRYIGKTTKSLAHRLRGHRHGKKGHVGRWVRLTLSKGLSPIIKEIGNCSINDNWQLIEQILISEMKYMGYNLCNICIGGEGASGRKLTASQRLDIGIRNAVPVYSKNIVTGEVIKHNSFAIAGSHFSVSQAAITNSVQRAGVCKGHLFSKTTEFKQNNNSINYNKNKLYGKQPRQQA